MLQLRWIRDKTPEISIESAQHLQPCYRRVGELSLSYANLWDAPLEEAGIALFDALEQSVTKKLTEWTELVAASGRHP